MVLLQSQHYTGGLSPERKLPSRQHHDMLTPGKALVGSHCHSKGGFATGAFCPVAPNSVLVEESNLAGVHLLVFCLMSSAESVCLRYILIKCKVWIPQQILSEGDLELVFRLKKSWSKTKKVLRNLEVKQNNHN